MPDSPRRIVVVAAHDHGTPVYTLTEAGGVHTDPQPGRSGAVFRETVERLAELLDASPGIQSIDVVIGTTRSALDNAVYLVRRR